MITMIDFDEDLNLEHEISHKVIEAMKLEPLKYRYTITNDDSSDEWKPEPNKIYEHYMSICIPAFLDAVTLDCDIDAYLDRIAINGICEFEWDIGYWTRKGDRKAKLNNPTWRDLFELANKAYIDGGCPDHSFLEGFGKDAKSDIYRFHFGS